MSTGDKCPRGVNVHGGYFYGGMSNYSRDIWRLNRLFPKLKKKSRNQEINAKMVS